MNPGTIAHWTVCDSTLRFRKKVHPFYFFDNFPNCKTIQIIFGGNTADKIWNKLTSDNFDIYSLCVSSLHRKMTPTFSQFQNVKMLMSYFRQFFRWWYCDRCFLQSLDHSKFYSFHAINDRPASLVNVLTYLDTKLMFSDEDWILIENLYVFN